MVTMLLMSAAYAAANVPKQNQLQLSEVLFELGKDTLHIPGYSCIPRSLYWSRKSLENGHDGHRESVDVMEAIVNGSCANANSWCSSPARACARCEAAWYCSKKCQRTHWEDGHKVGCFAGEE